MVRNNYFQDILISCFIRRPKEEKATYCLHRMTTRNRFRRESDQWPETKRLPREYQEILDGKTTCRLPKKSSKEYHKIYVRWWWSSSCWPDFPNNRFWCHSNCDKEMSPFFAKFSQESLKLPNRSICVIFPYSLSDFLYM